MTHYDVPDRPGWWRTPQGIVTRVDDQMLSEGFLTASLGGWQELELVADVLDRVKTAVDHVLGVEELAKNISPDVADLILDTIKRLQVPRV